METEEETTTRSWRPWAIAGGVGLFIVVAGASLLVWAASAYEGKTWPGMYVGSLPIGQMTVPELDALLAKAEVKLQNTDLVLNVVGTSTQTYTLNFQEIEALTGVKPVMIDRAAEVRRLVEYGKRDAWYSRGWHALMGASGRARTTLATVQVDETALEQAVRARVGVDQAPVNSSVTVTNISPIAYTITTSSPGQVLDLTGVAETVAKAWSKLEAPAVSITKEIAMPVLVESEIKPVADAALPKLFAGGSLNLQFSGGQGHVARRWNITPTDMAQWVTFEKKDGIIALSIRPEAINEFLTTTVQPSVQNEPQNAVFEVNSSTTKVTKFVPGRSGLTVDWDKTRAAMSEAFNNRVAGQTVTSTPMIAAEVLPTVTTAGSNNLGIAEELGSGFSNFSGSPRNRILNIKNAVQNKLNGTLVAPGAEFSLVNTLKPFTLAAGYLPELVILGDRITPEIAGGLCQVGTTMFRTVMNSGLEVTARTNHGMVISYYNDPSNGNPGTDATIYEPNPDFKFRNDTGHYVLVTTEMNTSNGHLEFHLWGTKDGRKGSYNPPAVLSWVPTGPALTFETNDLPPGKKECQGAHPGAVTSFDYTRTMPNGEKKVVTYKSTYRAVSARCFVGRDPANPRCPEGTAVCNVTNYQGPASSTPATTPASGAPADVPPVTIIDAQAPTTGTQTAPAN